MKTADGFKFEKRKVYYRVDGRMPKVRRLRTVSIHNNDSVKCRYIDSNLSVWVSEIGAALHHIRPSEVYRKYKNAAQAAWEELEYADSEVSMAMDELVKKSKKYGVDLLAE